LAAYNSRNEISDMILSKGCNVHIQNKFGNTALLGAARLGHTEICKLLISKGCNIDIQNIWGQTALIRAALQGHKEVCDYLISLGCKLNLTVSFSTEQPGISNEERDAFDGATAYIYACYGGHSLLAISLIEAGCNTSVTNKAGKSGMDLLKEKHPSKKVNEVQVFIFNLSCR
jgi:ankyrin repeat protein